MKEQTMTSIDADLKKQAKELGINISDLTERALRSKIGGTETTIPAETGKEECHICHRKMERQTREDLTKGLIWLCPDEVWCCQRCLNFKLRLIVVAV